MTQMSSVEALTQLGEGEQIVVRSRQLGALRWTRDATGAFAREGALVDATFFEGYVEDGRVMKVDDSPARPGEWFTQSHYDYYMLAYTEDRTNLIGLAFHDGVFRSDNEWRPEQFDTERTRMVRLEAIPARVQSNYESVKMLTERMFDRLAMVTGQLTTARERLAAKPEPANEAPPQERVMVTIRVTGTSTIAEPVARAAMVLPSQAVMETEPTADWSFEYRYLARPVAPGTCACDTVDRERVAQHVPPNTTQWDYTTYCPNCSDAESEES